MAPPVVRRKPRREKVTGLILGEGLFMDVWRWNGATRLGQCRVIWLRLLLPAAQRFLGVLLRVSPIGRLSARLSRSWVSTGEMRTGLARSGPGAYLVRHANGRSRSHHFRSRSRSDSDRRSTAFVLNPGAVSYTHLRAHETPEHLVCCLLL